ncbi:MAG: DUF3857 domain-containing protein [Myxococcota bacterium]
MRAPGPPPALLLPTLVVVAALRVAPAAAVPVGEEDVREAWSGLERAAGSPAAEARWLVVAPALEALPPAEQEEALRRLTRLDAPDVAVRAGAALARHRSAEAVRAWADDQGFASAWMAAGPVPTVPGEARTAHLELPSIPAPASGEDVPGFHGPVPWVPLRRRGPPGAVSFDHLLPDGEPAAVHLVARVEVPRRVHAVLRVGAAGHVAASVDGRLLGTARSLAFARPDQLRAPITLAPGAHVVAVTVSVDAARRGLLYARLTDRRGRPVDARWSLPDADTTWPSDPPPRPDEGEERMLPPSALRAEPSTPAARIRHAAARRALGLTDAGPSDDGDGALLEDLLLTPEALAMPPADLLLALQHVRRSEARSSVLLHAVSRGRNGASLLLALADLAAERGQWVRGESLHARAGAALGGTDTARVVGARVLRRAGRPVEAWRMLEGRAGREEASEALLLEAARAAATMDRPDRALPLLGRLHRALPGALEHAALYADTLASLGRVEEAVDVLAALARRRPDIPGYSLEAARVALASGDPERASALVSGVLTRAGYDVATLTTAARLQEEMGDLEAAVRTWRRALDLDPGAPEIRTALERLEPREEEAHPFERTVDEELLARPDRQPDSPFELLAEEIHVVVRPDGGYRRWEQRLLRVHRVPDDRESRTNAVRFDPSREDVRILSARVHRDGLALPVTGREVRQVAEAWYGLYYDMRALAVSFDDLRPGDVIELRHRVDGAASEAMPGTFNLLELLQDRLFKHEVLVTLTAPEGMGLRTRLVVPDGLREAGATIEESRERPGRDVVRHRVRVRELPPVPAEPAMPGFAEVGLLWQASSFATWGDLARRYDRLVEPQRVVTPAMRRWVRARRDEARGPDGHVSRARLVRGIVDGVTREIRYVGLEFGIHGWQPYRTDQVWVRRFGDCKDQATLLTTLLRVAGVPARIVLLRTRSKGRVPEPLPSLALFDHAVVYLPDMGRFVDPTARFYGLGELPRDDQGAQALILNPDRKVALERVPPDPPERNGLDGSYTVVLQPDGGARVEGVVTFRGIHAADYRRRLVEEDARAERLSKLLNIRYPGLELLDHSVSDPMERSRPLRLVFEGEVPRAAEVIGHTLQVRRPAGGEGHAARLAGEASRRSPLVVGPPTTLRFRFRYVLPIGWVPRDVPEGGEEATRFGRYAVTWQVQAGTVQASAVLQLRADQVAPDDYPAFRAFVQRFDETVRPPLVLVREPEPEQPDEPAREASR